MSAFFYPNFSSLAIDIHVLHDVYYNVIFFVLNYSSCTWNCVHVHVVVYIMAYMYYIMYYMYIYVLQLYIMAIHVQAMYSTSTCTDMYT